jgi:hypothetical protein
VKDSLVNLVLAKPVFVQEGETQKRLHMPGEKLHPMISTS